MHDSVLAYVAELVTKYDLSHGSVLEVGSAYVNGSVRSLFGGPYVGVDLVAGVGVDLVVRAGDQLPVAPDTYDVVVSTEALEHDERPWLTVTEMARVVRPGGHVIVTARGYDAVRGAFPVHNPPDRWRFSDDAMAVLAADAGLVEVNVTADPQVPGWFMHARRPGP